MFVTRNALSTFLRKKYDLPASYDFSGYVIHFSKPHGLLGHESREGIGNIVGSAKTSYDVEYPIIQGEPKVFYSYAEVIHVLSSISQSKPASICVWFECVRDNKLVDHFSSSCSDFPHVTWP